MGPTLSRFGTRVERIPQRGARQLNEAFLETRMTPEQIQSGQGRRRRLACGCELKPSPSFRPIMSDRTASLRPAAAASKQSAGVLPPPVPPISISPQGAAAQQQHKEKTIWTRYIGNKYRPDLRKRFRLLSGVADVPRAVYCLGLGPWSASAGVCRGCRGLLLYIRTFFQPPTVTTARRLSARRFSEAIYGTGNCRA